MKHLVLNVPDFPKKGVMFRDISPLLATPSHFQAAIDKLAEGIDLTNVDTIAGIESRGFILAAALAARTGKGFIPIRKKGKLPPPFESHSYALEYGHDTIEMKHGTGRVLLIDDVLATGGTLAAAIALCKKAGYTVQDVSVLIDLKYLNTFTWGNDRTVRSVIQYTE
jgi:adenine phosphoribosyltransferase